MAAVETTALQAQLDRSRKLTEAFQSQLKAREDAEQAKEEQSLQIASMVLSAVSRIPKAKDGKNGRDGIDGIDGIHGIDGARGLTGAKGAKGDKGDAGKDGKDGAAGINGIYGKDGIDGINGKDGIDGKDGEAGKDGLDGRDGTNGRDGVNGEAGPKGDRGEAGRDGKDGTNGLDGKDGEDGKEGPQGKKGPKGDQGPIGLTGKQGVKGKEGPSGKSGSDGVGIADINAYGQDLHIKLTDGTTKQVYMPVRGSSGVSAPVPPMAIQRAIRTPYDNRASKLTGETVQAAIDEIALNGAGGTYTNLTPVPIKLGGVAAGTTFDNMSISDVLDMLLYPYLAPSFTSFTGISGPIEVGNILDVGTVTLSWSTSNSSNINPDTIDIYDVTRSLILAADIANDGSEDALIAPITYTTPTQHTWEISAVSVESATFSRTMKVNWYSAIFYGESPLDTLTGEDVTTLRKKVLAANSSNIYDLLGGDYKWICYPTSMGLKTIFKDISTNFDVAMNPVETISVTNDFGVTQDYYCHRTYNILGGSITIAMS